MTRYEALDLVRQALVRTGAEVYYMKRPERPDNPFIVWQDEFDGRVLHGNGDRKLRTIEGSIDFWCKDQFCDMPEKIERELRKSCIKFRLNYHGIDTDIKAQHYEYIFYTPPIDEIEGKNNG